MSFLLDGEEQATLADALAFIDTFAHEAEEEGDCDGTSSDNSSTGSETSSLYVELRIPRATESAKRNGVPGAKSSSSTSNSTSSRDDDSARGDGVEQKKKKILKSREANTRAVYRYRKRNKTEILNLREQVDKLTSQLAELRNPDTVSITGHGSGYPRFNPKTKLLQLQPTTAAAVSFDNALMEYRKRLQSETLNRKLKDALTKQRRMNASLESVFQKHVSKIDLGFVMEIESQLQKKPKTCHEELINHETKMAYSQLQHYLRETIYESTPAIVAVLAKSDINCVFYHTLTKNDQRVGKIIEFMSNTPLQCSIEQLDPLLWGQLVHPIDNHNVTQSMAEAGHGDADGCERSFTMDLDGALGKVHVNGMSGIHKFVEPHRVVLAYTSLLSVEGSDLLLRENGWLIMSDALVSGCESAPTVFQTVYRLHAEQKNTTPMAPETQALRDFVMAAQSDKMRVYQLTIQKLLLEQCDWVSYAVGGLGGALPISCCAFQDAQVQQATATAAQVFIIITKISATASRGAHFVEQQIDRQRAVRINQQTALTQRLSSTTRLMSFLISAEDERATLEAALAFLDSCASDGEPFQGVHSPLRGDLFPSLDTVFSSQDLESSSTNGQLRIDNQIGSNSSDDNYGSVTCASSIQNGLTRADPSAHAEFHTGATVASSQKLKRLEERNSVVAVPSRAQARPTRQHRSDCEPTSPLSERKDSDTNKALAYSNAVQELQQLHKSESLNRKLRATWRQQIKLAKRLEGIIKKQLAPMQNLDALVDTTSEQLKTPSHNDKLPRSNSAVIDELYRYLEPLYRQSFSASASIGLRGTSRVFSSSHVHHDMALGETFEFMTNTPLVCDLRELDAHVRMLLSSHKMKLQKPHTGGHKPSQPTSTKHEHEFTKRFDCRFGEICVDGVSVARRVEEPHRVVITYASMLVFAEFDLAFWERGWLIMKAKNASFSCPRSESQEVLLQTCYRIHPETHSSSNEASFSSASRENTTAYFQNFILQSRWEEMRAKQLRLQAATLQKFGVVERAHSD